MVPNLLFSLMVLEIYICVWYNNRNRIETAFFVRGFSRVLF